MRKAVSSARAGWFSCRTWSCSCPRRRAVPAVLASAFALLFFGLGNYLGARQNADSDGQLAAMRAEIAPAEAPIDRSRRHGRAIGAGRAGSRDRHGRARRSSPTSSASCRTRWACCRSTFCASAATSFVELYSYDDHGSSSYGTAGYLGEGYFITVKHGVVALSQEGQADPRKITSVKLAYKGKLLNARVVDSGDASVEVDPGDWAIVKVKEPIDMPPLNLNLALRLRVRRSDLPPGQRLLEGDHPLDRLRRAADAEQAGDVPDRRPSRRVWRRRAQPRRRARRDPDRPDAGRLPLLVHPSAAAGDVPRRSGHLN